MSHLLLVVTTYMQQVLQIREVLADIDRMLNPHHEQQVERGAELPNAPGGRAAQSDLTRRCPRRRGAPGSA